MKGAFSALLKLYPRGYRALFAGEMTAVFEQTRRERRQSGWLAYTLFLLAEFAGVVRGAALTRSMGAWQNAPLRSALPYLAGAVVSLAFLRPLLYFGRMLPLTKSRFSTQDQKLELMALAVISIVLIAGFALAFVLNLRTVARLRAIETSRRHA
jgi:hypothetical protein